MRGREDGKGGVDVRGRRGGCEGRRDGCEGKGRVDVRGREGWI